MGRRTSHTTQRRRDRLAIGALRLTAWLPLRLNRALGWLIGRVLWLARGEARRVTDINLGICFPDATEEERRRLSMASLVETGKGMAELGWVWHHPEHALARTVDGEGQVRDTLEAGRSVVILAPHLGCWEVLNFWLSSRFDMHAMFLPSGLPGVDNLVRSSRETYGSTMHPATARGVASLARALKAGNALSAILPDQVPDRRSGRFAPFFGRDALTGTLACKLIQQSNARAFMAFARRLPGTGGYEIVLRDPDERLYSEDLDAAVLGLNHSIEALIREAPEQYLWSYRRFRRVRKGEKSPYK